MSTLLRFIPNNFKLLIELVLIFRACAPYVVRILVGAPKPIFKVSVYFASRLVEQSKHQWRVLRETCRAALAKTYVYSPLPDERTIRLLSIKPGGWTTPLTCALEEASLDDGTVFTATSYTWRKDFSWSDILIFIIWVARTVIVQLLLDALPMQESRAVKGFKWAQEKFENGVMNAYLFVFGSRSHFVLCNGKRLAVNANLYDFLLQLRQTDGGNSRYWIDAVCVDQLNIAERNRHVLLMSDIYRRAERVLAWLGRCPSLLNSAECIGSAHLLPEPSQFKEDNGILAFLINLPLRTCARLHLLSRGYFTRTWTIQEFMLPPKVFFLAGEFRFSPNDMAEVVRLTDVVLSRILPIFRADFVTSLLQSRQHYQEKARWSLSEYIAVILDHEVTDPRDLVYAGLGLLQQSAEMGDLQSDAGATIIDQSASPILGRKSLIRRPDYGADPDAVFISCAYELLTRDGFYALSFGHYGPYRSATKITDPLPSWATHLSGTHVVVPLKVEVGDVFSAGGTVKPTVTILPEHRLRLDSGADEVDVIEKVHKVLNWTVSFVLDLLDSLPDQYASTDESMFGALARTFIADGADSERMSPASAAQSLLEIIRKGHKSNQNLNVDKNPWLANVSKDHGGFKGPLKEFMIASANEDREKAKANEQRLLRAIEKGESTIQSVTPTAPSDDTQSQQDDMTDTNPDEPKPPNALSEASSTSPPKNENRSEQRDALDTMGESVSALWESMNRPGGIDLGNLINLFSGASSSVYERAVKQRFKNRCFFVTKTGMIGLGSSQLKQGDIVMVLAGAYVPFALRPVEKLEPDEEVRYRLYGEVYVHGIMDGERMLSSEWDPRPIMIE